MRLLIVGGLQGQIGLATKIAMDKGAKVTHARDIEQALATPARRRRAPTWCSAMSSLDIGALVAAWRPSASAPRWWPAASAPTPAAPSTPSAPAPRNICPCPPMPN